MNKSALIAYFLAWIVPGMGHIYYGKRMKGILFLVSIISLYLVGILIGGDALFYEATLLSLLGFIVKGFVGIIFVLTVILRPIYDNTAQYFEIGSAFMLMAGALNMLIMIDLFDEIRGRKNAKEEMSADATERIQ